MRKLIIIILLFPCWAQAQKEWTVIEPKEFLEDILAFEHSIPEGVSYSFSTNYKIFNDFADPAPIKIFSGRLISKQGIEFNIAQMGHFMVQNNMHNITVDSVDNQLIVQFSDPSFSYRKTEEDYLKLSKITQEIKRKTVGNKKHFSLTLIDGYPYHSMEYTFSGDNLISEIIIYGNAPYLAEDDNDYLIKKSKVIISF